MQLYSIIYAKYATNVIDLEYVQFERVQIGEVNYGSANKTGVIYCLGSFTFKHGYVGYMNDGYEPSLNNQLVSFYYSTSSQFVRIEDVKFEYNWISEKQLSSTVTLLYFADFDIVELVDC
jgi:hypothetical protein